MYRKISCLRLFPLFFSKNSYAFIAIRIFFISFLIFSFLGINTTEAAHTFGNKLQIAEGSGQTITASFTPVVGSTLLVLSIATTTTTTRVGGSPTFGGVAMINTNLQPDNQTEGTSEIWYLRNPTTGVAQNIVIPNSNGYPVMAIVSTFKAQSGYSSTIDKTISGYSASSANPSVTVPIATANGDVYVDSLLTGLSSVTSLVGNGTLLYKNDTGNEGNSSQYILQAIAGTQVMSWTQAADDWYVVAASFKEVQMTTPVLVTTSVGDIRKTTVMAVGNLSSNGNATITEKGFVWSTAMNPTISNSKIIVPGTGLGVFSGKITGLNENTSYYVRAYATNAIGTSYGGNVLFTTQSSPTIVLETPEAYNFGTDTTPTLQMTATDLNSDDVQYQIEVNELNHTIPQINKDSSKIKMWIAGGNGTDNIAYSYDGFNWTGVGNSIFGSSLGAADIAWNGNLYVAVGGSSSSGNTLAYSYDGINWLGLGNDIFDYGYGVAWNGTMFLATGFTSGPGGQFAYSYDGINWTPYTSSVFDGTVNDIAWNGSRWMAVSTSSTYLNTLGYSDDGFNWVGLGYDEFYDGGFGVATNGSRWVSVGRAAGQSSISWSDNGTNWTNLGVGIFASGFTVEWNGMMFVAGGGGSGTPNTLAYSYDGKTWVGLGTSLFTSNVMDVTWNGEMWLATGSGTNTLAYSYNGIDWTGLGTVSGVTNALATNNSVNLIPSISIIEEGLDFVDQSDLTDLNPFRSDNKVSYTFPASEALAYGTYTWRARAMDAGGSGEYSAWTAEKTFIIGESATPIITEGPFRIYENNNDSITGTPLAPENQSAELSSRNFRLRTFLGITGGDLIRESKNFLLQYSSKSGTCDAAFDGEDYIDVDRFTPIAFYDNYAVDDLYAIEKDAADPHIVSGDVISQSYIESNNFGTVSDVIAGNSALFDFSLRYLGVHSQESFCLRITNSGKVPLDSYSYIPEIISPIYRSRKGNTSSIESGATPGSTTSGGNKNDGADPVVLPQCSDTIDNDSDTLADTLDPQCHLDGSLGKEYIPTHNSETIAPVTQTGGGQGDNGGDLGFNWQPLNLFNFL